MTKPNVGNNIGQSTNEGDLMPKENTELIEMFKKCNTYTKFVIYRLLQDGIPRTVLEVCKSTPETFFRTAVTGALQALQKSGMITYDTETKTYTDANSVILRHDLSTDAITILKLLDEKDRLPLNLQEISEIAETEFVEIIKQLISLNLIEYKTTTFNNQQIEVLHLR